MRHQRGRRGKWVGNLLPSMLMLGVAWVSGARKCFCQENEGILRVGFELRTSVFSFHALASASFPVLHTLPPTRKRRDYALWNWFTVRTDTASVSSSFNMPKNGETMHNEVSIPESPSRTPRGGPIIRVDRWGNGEEEKVIATFRTLFHRQLVAKSDGLKYCCQRKASLILEQYLIILTAEKAREIENRLLHRMTCQSRRWRRKFSDRLKAGDRRRSSILIAGPVTEKGFRGP